ncbi:uncharacterized protein FMAN_11970 [Fusarium mangiferae]|uniref:NAD(P)-binding domain-containing protein n=1 Tax=Fusarium mangiferae TaxID=192010 RepID=A0A1L7UIA4_FUSMA|nr:uncharacterized protein FMAN_11970 [Fusarium mangiferae]CVL06876.1 uncharacterized protein FMAN_11970 [Fusarium mangiferae]
MPIPLVKLVVVAVAGGTGGIGSAIVDTLCSNPHQKMIILTRKIPDARHATDTFVTLEYSDVGAMAKALDDNVHTVISALRVFNTASTEADSNLVKATAQAKIPRRFVASAWGIQYAGATPVGQARGRTLAELRTTNLGWSRFDNGFFLDYYGPPTLESYMQRVAWAIEIANNKAGFREQEMNQSPSRFKFDVSYDPAEKLEKGEVTELPFNKNATDFPQKVLEGLMSHWGIYASKGKYDMLMDKALNNVFTSIQLLKVEDVMEMWR